MIMAVKTQTPEEKNTKEFINISGVSNSVYKLSNAGKTKENVLELKDSRKSEFESLVTALTNSTPMMGRDILITAELYDSNILKGSQESKKERV